MKRWGNFSLLALLGAVMLALYRVQGGQAISFLLYGTAVWLGYALAAALLSLRRVEAASEADRPRYYADEQAEVEVRIRQRSYGPVLWMIARDWWVLGDGSRVSRHTLLFPGFRSELAYRYRLGGLQRGPCRLERVELLTGDVFGLLQIRRQVSGGASFTVYPKPMRVAIANGREAYPGGDGRSAALPLVRPESYLVNGVRDYMNGDPLQRIHWKMTARTGALKSKTFDPALPSRLLVVLDASAASYSGGDGRLLFETAVRAAAGLMRDMHAAGNPAGLCCSGGDPGGVGLSPAFDGGLQSAYETLARVRPDGAGSFAEFLLREAERWPADRPVVCVTPATGEAMLSAASRLRAGRRGCSLVLVHASPTLSWTHREWQRQLEDWGCGFADVSPRRSSDVRHTGGARNGIA